MSNPIALSRIANEFAEAELEMSSMGSSSYYSSISLHTPVSRNSLSQALNNVKLSPVSTPSTQDNGSSLASQEKEDDEGMHQLEKISLLMDRQAERTSMNITLFVKYFASPLRLYIKTLLQSMPMEMRVAYANAIRISDRVKTDLVGEWNANDTFGLKILVKMYRLFNNVLPLIQNNTEFLKYFDPHFNKISTEERARVQPITYFMLNCVMNPGVALHPNGEVSLENEAHQWYDNFLIDRKDEIEEVTLTLKDAQERLRKKLALDLNSYAAVVFKKPVRFKYSDMSTGEVKEDVFQPEQLIQELHQKFMSTPGAMILGEQMTYWLLNDDPTPAVMRGGKSKQHKKDVKRKKVSKK